MSHPEPSVIQGKENEPISEADRDFPIRYSKEELLGIRASVFPESLADAATATKQETTDPPPSGDRASDKASNDDHQAPGDCDTSTVIPDEKLAKKKKKKSSGKNKLPNPSGFEEFYADPPITPEDHYEEKHDIYHQ